MKVSKTVLRPYGTTPFLKVALASVLCLQGCSNVSYVQRESPSNLYKEYRHADAAIIGVGQPISARQMTANATLSLQGDYDLEQVMQRISGTYNVAVRWGNGVRKGKRTNVMLNKLGFDEARNYIEDTFDIQVIREGERRLLVLPSASEPRLANFNPGDDVSLSSALKGLAGQCGYNLVITENQEKLSATRITTHLKDVTCYDAFEALLNPQGLSLVNTGDYYTIGGLPQRQWTVQLNEPVRDEEQTVTLTSDSSGGSSSSSGSSGGSQSASGSNKVTIKYERNLWADLETDLNALITNNCPASSSASSQSGAQSSTQGSAVAQAGGPTLLPPPSVSGGMGDANLIRATSMTSVPVQQAVTESASSSTGSSSTSNPACGYVRINQAVGLVQMRAPLSVLQEADQIVQRVQDIASRRLLLEARVMAVTRSRGFNQDGALNIGNRNIARGEQSTVGFGGSVASALAGELLGFTGSINGQDVAAGGASFSNNNIDVAVSLLEKFGTTYTLMRPMIELMDRQRATLIDGTNQRYYVITSQSTTGTSTTTSNSVEERSQFIGLQFSASAQIGEEGDAHTISLQIPITEQQGTVNIPNPNYTGTNEKYSGQAPIVTTRLIDQKVRVRDGEIKVIGGLTKTMAIDNESGLPVVRNITALGKLANSENISYQNVEFVVLLQVRRLS